MKKCREIAAVLLLGICLVNLSGCEGEGMLKLNMNSADGRGMLKPNLISTEWTTADQYLTDNPRLVEKYGEGYEFKHGGHGTVQGDSNWRGYSGYAVLGYIVNDEDTYSVFLSRKKSEAWIVDAIIATYPQYRCREIPLSFCVIDYDLDTPNGVYLLEGEETGVDVRFGMPATISVDIPRHRYYPRIEDGKTVYRIEYDWENVFIANCTFDFDEFTAVLTDEFAGILGEDVKQLSFYIDDSTAVDDEVPSQE